nr:uncharacterized protein LOC129388051 [Dermacentor andersoni]
MAWSGNVHVRKQNLEVNCVRLLAAPADFEVTAAATGPYSVRLVVFVPPVKNGALDLCYITLNGTDGGRSFSCNNHGGNASTLALKGLDPGREYVFSVTFANMHGGWEIGTRKVISVTTTAAPLNADSERRNNAALAYFVAGLIAVFLKFPYSQVQGPKSACKNKLTHWDGIYTASSTD